jgi:UDP:flavonoid glycosyltransferase YjiC (YdhE family)
MSNILVLIEPIEGHFNPLGPIIKQFVARKHNVVCLSGKAYQQQIEAMGATFIPHP